jgi:hypothetical protein
MGPSSRGLFQQMDSWGPLSVRMDPAGSARLFYNALLALNPSWKTSSVAMQAQRVEQSEFSDGSNYFGNLREAIAITRALGFDHGGWMKSGGIGVNMRNKPEAVLTPTDSAAYVGHAKALDSGSGQTVRLVIEGHGDLADFVREHATVVVEDGFQTVTSALGRKAGQS